MMLSIKLRRPTLTWMCLTSKLKIKLKCLPYPSPQRILRIFMLKMLIKATRGQPRHKVSKVIPNPLLMIPVSPSRRRELILKSSIFFFFG